MAAIDDLIAQIDNPELRDRIQQELKKVVKNKKFGLVFERHLPECTPLYDISVKSGATVARYGDMNTLYKVLDIEEGIALCQGKNVDGIEKISVDNLVIIAEFGEPIYPYLEPLDSVENAPDSGLWHTLIEADNYHALQLLDYMYHGKVDCIYIDPPYNTGAKDWKYNNDYVDGNDSYRHSKWLSMMEKRLLLAKKLLNPNDSVLIVTIDEKEYLHLGCLLEDLFPEANIQMVSSRINATGVIRLNEFARVDEYIFFLMIGNSLPYTDSIPTDSVKPVLWHGLRRRDAESYRGSKKGGIAQFYPIYINDDKCCIEKIGDAIPHGVDRNTAPIIDGCTAVFPLKPDGTEMNWGLIGTQLKDRVEKGYVRVKRSKNAVSPYTIEYLTSGYIKDIEEGKARIIGYNDDGSVIAEYAAGTAKTQLPTQWNNKHHYSKEYGTSLLKKIFDDKRFSYPKSLYAVQDSIRLFVSHKPSALILDFFAGSGTTLHAVNLLNAEDGGNRRCIMVTNNEVSDDEAKYLTKQGHKPGDEAWNKLGIARYVTWPRTVCSIEGHDINDQPLKGNYIDSDRPMADGFPANANFFKLGFLDKMDVYVGTQLEKLIPVLWMKANAFGKCPSIVSEEDYYIFPENRFAILVNESSFKKFKNKIAGEDLDVVYIVTNFEPGYIRMRQELGVPTTYQLYRDYLDNFRINQR